MVTLLLTRDQKARSDEYLFGGSIMVKINLVIKNAEKVRVFYYKIATVSCFKLFIPTPNLVWGFIFEELLICRLGKYFASQPSIDKKPTANQA